MNSIQYPTPHAILQIQNLTRSFGNFKAVDNLNLSINEGEIFGFLGPNGAGKTTTISMICGLLKPDSGRILLDGKDLTQDGKLIKKHIGICPQQNLLWDKLTCMEQLTFMRKMYDLPTKNAREKSAALLESFGLADKSHCLASKLSGGMRRRLNLALAFVHDPQILILDEPEAGLDPQSRVIVREYIRSWASNPHRTVILTTHNMDEAERMVNRVGIIDNGKLLVIDTPDALKHHVGEGDILEIALPQLPEPAFQAVKDLLPHTQFNENILSIHGQELVSKLPAIMEILNQHGVQIEEIRLRENTLEDVFISLTGRRLRE